MRIVLWLDRLGCVFLALAGILCSAISTAAVIAGRKMICGRRPDQDNSILQSFSTVGVADGVTIIHVKQKFDMVARF